MNIKTIPLGHFSPAEFLRQYWQKRPLVIRQAMPEFNSPLSAEELAGLACEPTVESRLILENAGNSPWEVREGPFTEQDFTQLPETHWTLLVQEVNRHVPEIADLLDRFNFVPSWRLDDLMISYAAPQGSVGPHVDNYDVFLLQAQGLKRWQISYQVGELMPNLDLRLLQNFRPEENWVLEPGDMLYLPPNIAHYGVALDDSLTFSIGFLAPSYNELFNDYVHTVTANMDEHARYTDPELQPVHHPGEISQEALGKIQKVIRSLPLDNQSINRWFGKFISESRVGVSYPRPHPPFTPDSWQQEYQACGYLRRAARMCFIREASQYILFVEGQMLPLPAEIAFAAVLLTEQRDFPYAELAAQLNPALIKLLTELTNLGYFYFFELEEA